MALMDVSARNRPQVLVFGVLVNAAADLLPTDLVIKLPHILFDRIFIKPNLPYAYLFLTNCQSKGCGQVIEGILEGFPFFGFTTSRSAVWDNLPINAPGARGKAAG
jgi:hypothetical protein